MKRRSFFKTAAATGLAAPLVVNESKAGGYVVATGTPEEIAESRKSITGPFLAELLARSASRNPARKTTRRGR